MYKCLKNRLSGVLLDNIGWSYESFNSTINQRPEMENFLSVNALRFFRRTLVQIWLKITTFKQNLKAYIPSCYFMLELLSLKSDSGQ